MKISSSKCLFLQTHYKGIIEIFSKIFLNNIGHAIGNTAYSYTMRKTSQLGRNFAEKVNF